MEYITGTQTFPDFFFFCSQLRIVRRFFSWPATLLFFFCSGLIALCLAPSAEASHLRSLPPQTLFTLLFMSSGLVLVSPSSSSRTHTSASTHTYPDPTWGFLLFDRYKGDVTRVSALFLPSSCFNPESKPRCKQAPLQHAGAGGLRYAFRTGLQPHLLRRRVSQAHSCGEWRRW